MPLPSPRKADASRLSSAPCSGPGAWRAPTDLERFAGTAARRDGAVPVEPSRRIRVSNTDALGRTGRRSRTAACSRRGRRLPCGVPVWLSSASDRPSLKTIALSLGSIELLGCAGRSTTGKARTTAVKKSDRDPRSSPETRGSRSTLTSVAPIGAGFGPRLSYRPNSVAGMTLAAFRRGSPVAPPRPKQRESPVRTSFRRPP